MNELYYYVNYRYQYIGNYDNKDERTQLIQDYFNTANKSHYNYVLSLISDKLLDMTAKCDIELKQ